MNERPDDDALFEPMRRRADAMERKTVIADRASGQIGAQPNQSDVQREVGGAFVRATVNERSSPNQPRLARLHRKFYPSGWRD